ncbi:hypothetical protein B0H19DRAFT_1138762 [Mycena capillaripes]|nr:hypothetical protein B0H19DRAFT_1138762 [Mycena capillaripes]
MNSTCTLRGLTMPTVLALCYQTGDRATKVGVTKRIVHTRGHVGTLVTLGRCRKIGVVNSGRVLNGGTDTICRK